ncbi:hypothetical protein LYZ37_23815 (plasmid) [Vibrio tubiashii]|uniref:hypothetical protein n=1 Tax=Vibrio TaxID=662 RepID=UPI00234F3450|nr:MULTISPECIES: hypothetical protein [Vibrio]ELA7834291.1 hypothetical protein [Vibrio alginolyticus]MDW1661203.1 hypothetical protein [Vibrio sp. Vb2658]WCP70195.1 hypothetical protein LYZ37_23815 [Vibrio tubiashii]
MSTDTTSIWTIISSLSSLGSFGVAALVGWHGYQKYLAEEHIEPSDDRLELFSTRKQTTELRVENNQLRCYLHDIRDNRGGLQWSLSKQQIDKVKVTKEATSSVSGRIKIGPRSGWLYSYKLWSNPRELEKAIQKLVDTIEA